MKNKLKRKKKKSQGAGDLQSTNQECFLEDFPPGHTPVNMNCPGKTHL